jgi:hypothetical protein
VSQADLGFWTSQVSLIKFEKNFIGKIGIHGDVAMCTYLPEWQNNMFYGQNIVEVSLENLCCKDTQMTEYNGAPCPRNIPGNIFER